MSAGDEPDLSVSERELAAIRGDADLLSRITTEGGYAAGSTYDAVQDLRAAGLDSGSALHHAMWRFTEQSLALGRRCRGIVDHLGQTVTDHAALEADITARLRQDAPVPLNLGITEL